MPRGGARLRTEDGKMNMLGPRVHARRDELGLGQDDLCARLASVTGGKWNPGWQDISRVENGARLVSDLEIHALAKALDCSACWLLEGQQQDR